MAECAFGRDQNGHPVNQSGWHRDPFQGIRSTSTGTKSRIGLPVVVVVGPVQHVPYLGDVNPPGRTRPAAPPPRRPPEPHPRMSTHGPRLRPAGQLEPGTATTPQGATSSQGRRRADAHRSAANPSRPNSSRTGYGPANPMTHLKSGPVKPRCQHRSWCSISRRTRAGAAPCRAGLRTHRARGDPASGHGPAVPSRRPGGPAAGRGTGPWSGLASSAAGGLSRPRVDPGQAAVYGVNARRHRPATPRVADRPVAPGGPPIPRAAAGAVGHVRWVSGGQDHAGAAEPERAAGQRVRPAAPDQHRRLGHPADPPAGPASRADTRAAHRTRAATPGWSCGCGSVRARGWRRVDQPAQRPGGPGRGLRPVGPAVVVGRRHHHG